LQNQLGESISLNVTQKSLAYLNPARMEGPASTSPLVDTITGSTTKAAFIDRTKSNKKPLEFYLKYSPLITDTTLYLELETPLDLD